MITINELKNYLAEHDLAPEEVTENALVVTIKGNTKLQINVAMAIGTHTFRIESFVARNPDENHEAVYRWMLEENRKLLSTAFCLDGYGDIYLRSSLPMESLTLDQVDQLLGIIVAQSDRSFNVLLELGFKSAIEREWAWRTSRGMSTANLEAFTHLFND